MRHEDEHDEPHLDGLLRCPSCGGALKFRLLELPDEDEPETLLLFDCPTGDFHATATREDIVAVLTAAVREQLGYGRLVNPAA